jgi:predicted permease
MKRMGKTTKKEAQITLTKDISNNILLLIFLVITFVTIMGAIVVVDTIENYQQAQTGRQVVETTPAATGYVGVTITGPPADKEVDEEP